MSLKTFNQDNLIWNMKAFPAKLTTDEDIVLVIREDIIVMVFRALRYIILFAFLIVAKIIFGGVTDLLLVELINVAFFSICALLLILFAYQYHNYILSFQVVTNVRLIDVDQKGVFRREVNELAIEKIEDVTHKQNGLLQSVFNYGTVSVQSAAEISNSGTTNSAITSGFVFENVSQPSEVQATINAMFHQERTLRQHQNAQLNAHYMNRMLSDRQNPNGPYQPEAYENNPKDPDYVQEDTVLPPPRLNG